MPATGQAKGAARPVRKRAPPPPAQRGGVAPPAAAGFTAAQRKAMRAMPAESLIDALEAVYARASVLTKQLAAVQLALSQCQLGAQQSAAPHQGVGAGSGLASSLLSGLGAGVGFGVGSELAEAVFD